jgi:homoserine O-succinyltransferase
MRIAILDLNDGEANEGIRGILQLVQQFKDESAELVEHQIFDVRAKNEIADLNFDTYISSGGPGSPLASEGSDWEQNYFGLMNGIIQHNRNNPFQRKHVFLICHSFQIFCRHYGYAKVTKRKSTSFGVLPISFMKEGKGDPLFAGLEDPFYAVDSRDYQIVQPNEGKIWSGGGNILCIEKERPFVALERAVMAVRFNEAIVGTQFHPEADADGTYRYLIRDDKRKIVIEKHGEKKYNQMLSMVNEPDKIRLTYKTIIPTFLRVAQHQ